MIEEIKEKDKEKKIEKAIKSAEEITRLVDKINRIYKIKGDEKDIRKALIDITYKQAQLYSLALTFNQLDDKTYYEEKRSIAKELFKIRCEQNVIIIETPLPPLKIGPYKSSVSELFKNVISEMISDYIYLNNLKTPIFKKADVHFLIYLGKDNPYNAVPDADNLDLKALLDAMKLSLFSDDNLLNIKYQVSGVKTIEESKMKIYVAALDT